ncbi:MAG: hypothetical protein AAGK78_12635, partial [Planctomycetota bacterium]
MRTAYLTSARFKRLGDIADHFGGVSVKAQQLLGLQLSQTGKREIRAALARHNLRGAAILTELPKRHLMHDLDQVLDRTRESLELARDLGFEMVGLDLGEVRPVPQRADHPKEPIDPGPLLLPNLEDVEKFTKSAPPKSSLVDTETITAALQELAKIVERIGVPLACGATLSHQESLAAALAAVDHPQLFRELDPGAAVLELEADVDAVIDQAPAVRH